MAWVTFIIKLITFMREYSIFIIYFRLSSIITNIRTEVTAYNKDLLNQELSVPGEYLK